MSQEGAIKNFDVLVIGTGLSGLHYCMQLLTLSPKLKVALISKANALECNSQYAQGGVAATHNKNDSFKSHLQDTMVAGDGLCNEESALEIIKNSPRTVKELQQYDIKFSLDDSGDYHLAKEGGHSHRRIFNCGDHTGYTITSSLLDTVKKTPQIELFENHIAVNLITQKPAYQIKIKNEVLGAYILNCETSKIDAFLAKAVVLATGGAGKTYRYTTNSLVATGDGVAMAYRAGARIGNMEFYQFHPTLLYHHEINNFLISEAVRGEGALLRNADNNKQFMQNYEPLKRELATRDVVSRAIFNEIENSEHSFVHLDITHHSQAFLKKRFPQIYKTLMSKGIDMSQDLIPVVPAAHYQCGGVLANTSGQTDLERMYVIGEVAFTGFHGANRLASNSLLEATVMATKAAHASLTDINTPWKFAPLIHNWDSPSKINNRRASQINAHWRSIRGEMTSYAGIIRTEDGLADLLQLIDNRKKIIEEYYWKHKITRDFIELRNIVLNAEMIVRFALNRRESRGGHYREDYPFKNERSTFSSSDNMNLY